MALHRNGGQSDTQDLPEEDVLKGASKRDAIRQKLDSAMDEGT